MKRFSSFAGLLVIGLTLCVGTLFGSSRPSAPTSPPRLSESLMIRYGMGFVHIREKRPWLNPARATLHA